MARADKTERRKKKREEKRKKALRAQEADRAEHYLIRAEFAIRVNDPGAAATMAEKALHIDPDNSSARRMLASLSLEKGELPAAERYSRELTELGDDWHAEGLLGEALRLQHRWKEAVERYQRAIKLLASTRPPGTEGFRSALRATIEACKRSARFGERWEIAREKSAPGAVVYERRGDTPRPGAGPAAAPALPPDGLMQPVPPVPVAYQFEATAVTLSKLAESCPFENAAEELRALAEAARAVTVSAKGEHFLRVLGGNAGTKIVFTYYRATQEYLARLLERAGVSATLFHGQMTAAEKDASVERFKGGGAEVFLSTESGGEGRNLQFCNTIVNYDLPWNPMRIEQRIGRVHRIGQTRDVFVFNFSAKGTVEDYLLEVLDEKINMFELVIGEVEMILGNLTDEREFPDIVMELWASAASNAEAAEKFRTLGDELLSAKTKYDDAKRLDDALFGDDYEVSYGT
jgi:tetratricopeptide (TPR) repeat protein